MDEEVKADLFRTLGRIEEKLDTQAANHAEQKKLVDKHEKVYQAGKVMAIPGLAAMHLTLKYFYTKLGL